MNSGAQLNVFNPRPHDIRLADIVFGLSREARWNGQLEVNINVAQHSCMVCQQSPRDIRKFALLHDATEGLGLKDLPAPVKDGMEEYKAVEKVLQRMVYMKYIGREPDADEKKELKKWDVNVTKTEAYRWHPHYDEKWFPESRVLAIPELASPWDEQTARSEMNEWLRELGIKEKV